MIVVTINYFCDKLIFMNYYFLISLASKLIPESKLKRYLAQKFEKQIMKARKNMKNPAMFTFSSNKRINVMLSLLTKCIQQNLEGDIIECGVYKGGSSYKIAKELKKLCSKKTLYSLDTFEGHPYDDYNDMPRELFDKAYGKKKPRTYKGKLNDVDLNEIKNLFTKEKLDNTIFLKGLFIDNFKVISNKKFCFAHIDADTYLSVKQCIEFLKDRLVSKGIIVFDDYNLSGFGGCDKAVDSLLGKSIKPLKPFGAYWEKP